MIKRKPLELSPEIARRFYEDLRAYHAEKNPIKADEIASRQLHALRQYQRPRARIMGMTQVRLIKHEAVPKCGSFEVRCTNQTL